MEDIALVRSFTRSLTRPRARERTVPSPEIPLSRAYVLQRASCCVETRPFFPSGAPSPPPSPPISLRRQIHPHRCTRTRTSRAKQSTPTRTQDPSLCRAPRNTRSREHPHGPRAYAHTYTQAAKRLETRRPHTRTYATYLVDVRVAARAAGEVLKLADRSAGALRVCSERGGRW